MWTTAFLKAVEPQGSRTRLYVVYQNDHGADPLFQEYFTDTVVDATALGQITHDKLIALNATLGTQVKFSIGAITYSAPTPDPTQVAHAQFIAAVSTLSTAVSRAQSVTRLGLNAIIDTDTPRAIVQTLVDNDKTLLDLL